MCKFFTGKRLQSLDIGTLLIVGGVLLTPLMQPLGVVLFLGGLVWPHYHGRMQAQPVPARRQTRRLPR